jgi:hypothetical protein
VLTPFECAAPLNGKPRIQEGATAVRDEVWLLGQPPLSDYLDFVERLVDGGAAMDKRAICDAWRTANDYYYELEKSEAAIADDAECLDLPERLMPMAEALTEHPYFRKTFDYMPYSFGMVELDRLIVYQPHVTLPFVEALQKRLDPRPDLEGLFRFCLPLDRSGDPPVTIRRMGTRRFVFSSDSSDLRFHEPTLLNAGQVAGYETFGPIGAVVGLIVGYGSNFLNVIRSDGRMLLHNGYHRAYALRAIGFTHAPCVIQTVTRRDELTVVATQQVVDEPAFFFKAARPPLLKDFFDPKIRIVLPVRRMEKVIEVTFEVTGYDVPSS